MQVGVRGKCACGHLPVLLGACCSCANVPFRASTSTGKYPWEMLSPTIRTLGIDSLIGTVGRFGSHAVFAPALPLLLRRHPKQFSRCGGTFAGYSKWHAPVEPVFNSHDQPAGHDVCARVVFPGPDLGQRAGEEPVAAKGELPIGTFLTHPVLADAEQGASETDERECPRQVWPAD
eukprot:COSAG02_NODE_227_length_28153_cov_11.662294_16_plen_176_part_00